MDLSATNILFSEKLIPSFYSEPKNSYIPLLNLILGGKKYATIYYNSEIQ